MKVKQRIFNETKNKNKVKNDVIKMRHWKFWKYMIRMRKKDNKEMKIKKGSHKINGKSMKI